MRANGLFALGMLMAIAQPAEAMDPVGSYQEVICHDNRMYPVRVCMGAAFLRESDFFRRIAVVVGTIRIRMNATNLAKLRNSFDTWRQGRYPAPFADQEELANADPRRCLEFDQGSWSDLGRAQSCGYSFPGLFDFEKWLDSLASDAFDRGVYAKTKALFGRFEKEICVEELRPWWSGSMLVLGLPADGGGSRAFREDMVGRVQALQAQYPRHARQIGFTMNVLQYSCDKFLAGR